VSTVHGHGRERSESIWNAASRQRAPGPGLFQFFLGGLTGTAAIMLTLYFADPLIRGQTIDPARMAQMALGNPRGMGRVLIDVFKGVTLFPLVFAFLSVRLPGSAAVKGLIWGALLWALAQVLVIIPELGAGLFGETPNGLEGRLTSLAGYLLYGGLQGLVGGRRSGSNSQTQADACERATRGPA
jgi:hypothetical protein